MIDFAGASERVISYSRHPASLEEHGRDAGVSGFVATTWFPLSIAEWVAQEAAVAALMAEPAASLAEEQFVPPPLSDAADISVPLAEFPEEEPLHESLLAADYEADDVEQGVEPATLAVLESELDDRRSLRTAAEDPVDLGTQPAAPRRVRRRRSLVGDTPAASARFRIGAGIGLAAAAILLLALAVWVGPTLFGAGQMVEAVFNAPMLVIRSATPGRVQVVSVQTGQAVQPSTVLMTLHTDTPNIDRPITAGVRGVIRSVETVPGAVVTEGAPLVRIHDCDRVFLTLPPATRLTEGEAVRIRLPHGPAFTGRVRASAGVMEPPDTKVVGVAPGVAPGDCPVGVAAEVTPVPPAPTS